VIEKLPIIQASLKYSVVHMENSVEADLRVGDILCAVRHGWHVWLRGAELEGGGRGWEGEGRATTYGLGYVTREFP